MVNLSTRTSLHLCFRFLKFRRQSVEVTATRTINPDIDVESEYLSESLLILNHQLSGAYQLGNCGTFDLKQRRVVVRTDPVYKHTDLAEAVRLEDVEDVNKSRSYLIYTLAMSEKQKLSIARLEIAQLYIHCGADVNIVKGWNGESALMIAIRFNNPVVAELLVDNGADVCHAPPDGGLIALYKCVSLAATRQNSDTLKMMGLLLKQGANPN